MGQLKQLHCDVAHTQETHMSNAEHIKLKMGRQSVLFLSCSTRGVVGFKRRGVNSTSKFKDSEGRFIRVNGATMVLRSH